MPPLGWFFLSKTILDKIYLNFDPLSYLKSAFFITFLSGEWTYSYASSPAGRRDPLWGGIIPIAVACMVKLVEGSNPLLNFSMALNTRVKLSKSFELKYRTYFLCR